MEQPFKIDFLKGAGDDTVKFHGDINAHADYYFDTLVQQVSARRVIMDFSNAGRINPMGIALLLRSIKIIKAEKKAEVSIRGLNKLNTQLFRMTGIFLIASEARSA